ncbi:MAG: phosphoribosylglycinamide synthetase C domain-containing protein, partial [Pseudomonadota bacterium]
SDLTVLCEAALTGTLHEVDVEWDKRAALGIVLAAGGYPGSYDTGAIIDGLDADLGDDVTVFHAGTKTVNGRVVSNSGRVLCVTALGDNVRDAADKAYQAADKIHWEGRFFRPDIGYRAIRRELQPDDD